MPRQQIVTKMTQAKVAATPGKRFLYNNAVYGMVEDVITKASGKPYPKTIKDELFKPLGMLRASLGYEALMAAPDKAYPHVKAANGKYMPADKYSSGYYAFSAAGGVNASIQDLIPFLQVYLGKPNQVISKAELQQLTKPFVQNPTATIKLEAKKGAITNTYYGFGWHSMEYNHHKVVYHQGHLKGFRNFMGFAPDDVGIIILTNADKRHAGKIAINFFDLYFKA